ncbi:hypothetical protein MASR2M41_25600 [Flammeovirgaceae bacterium]
MDSAQQTKIIVDPELVGGILGQIPSPLEISALLKASGTKYNNKFLNAPENHGKYSTSYKQALNLGIYGTDLGYTNIYEQNLDGIKYLGAIKLLAENLSLGQFFDIETIGRLAANSNNLDSLLLLTTQNFNSINNHLQSQNRANLSVLLLIGGWVEAMDITCQVANLDLSNKQLHETIGSQKIILEQIMLLLSFYKGDTTLDPLLADFQELKLAFDKINITYTYGASTMEIVDGVAVIKDNSTTTILITQADIEDIGNKTSVIRNKIIS